MYLPDDARVVDGLAQSARVEVRLVIIEVDQAERDTLESLLALVLAHHKAVAHRGSCNRRE